MTVNQKIKKYLEEHGITQMWLSQNTGIAQEKISNIVNGKRRVTADELLSICSVLNISADLFLKPLCENA